MRKSQKELDVYLYPTTIRANEYEACGVTLADLISFFSYAPPRAVSPSSYMLRMVLRKSSKVATFGAPANIYDNR